MLDLYWKDDVEVATLEISTKARRISEVLKRKNGYIILPTFTVPTVWLGASYIVAQYNYSVPFDFSFIHIPAELFDANYIICVRYRIGDTIFRRAFNPVADRPSIIGLLYVDTYAGERIKKYFSLEVWSTNSGAYMTNNAPITFPVSIKHKPTDFCNTLNVNEGDSELCLDGLFDDLPFNPVGEQLEFGQCSPWKDGNTGEYQTPGAGISATYITTEDGSVLTTEDGKYLRI